jgi:hypothetical protein
MGTPIFDKLSKEERLQVVKELHDYQSERCYICEGLIDLAHPVDVDHIRSKDRGGIDSRNNWGLTHAHCNRSKGNKDLDLQRYLMRFQKARKIHMLSSQGEDAFTVGIALSLHGGAKKDLIGKIVIGSDASEYFITTWEIDGQIKTIKIPVLTDQNNSNVKSITVLVPKEYCFHDADINPRSIVDLEPFIEEFYRGNPQLQPSLAHLILDRHDDGKSGRGHILIFDGQHKAAAQLFLGNSLLYLRVFLNTDITLLKNTNFGAHTKLAQIRFPMAIQDKVGHDIFRPAFEEYLNSLDDRSGIKESAFFKKLTKEERSEMRSHFQGYLKFRVVSAMGAEGAQFFKYVETISARSKTKPLAYETVRKAIFNNFLCLHETDDPIDIALEMRDKERDNLIRLLRLFTDKFLDRQFDLGKGIYKIEERLSTDPSIKDPHLRAYRLCRQAPFIVVMRELKDAIAQLLSIRRRYQNASWYRGQFLWADFDESEWSAIDKMIEVILSHKVWIERNEAYTRILSDTRLSSWDAILIRGTLPGAANPVYEPLDHSILIERACRG